MNINQVISNYKNTVDAMAKAAPKPAEQVAKPDQFGQLMGNAIENISNQLKTAESQSIKAAAGEANIQDVVEALTNAEMTLTTVTAVRDKVIDAYQNIINMPI